MSHCKALFVVDTPAQIFNLKEALDAYEVNDYDIIICDCCRADAYAQLRSQISSLAPSKVIEVPRVEGDVRDRIAIYAQHLPWLKQQNYSLIFFSNIRQQWQRDIVCSLRNVKAVLMDDGNATLMFYHFLFRHQQFFDFPADSNQHRANQAAEIRRHFEVDIEQPEMLELFTIFNLEELPWLSVRHNPLAALRHNHNQLDEQHVLFLGIGAVELKYMTAESYIQLLRESAELFPEKQFIYQPHRISSVELVERIAAETNFTVMRLNKPVEEWLKDNECPPATVVSFFSMALSTCALCFPKLKVVSLAPKLDTWHGAMNSHVWNMTQCNNLQIIEVIMNYLRQDLRVEVIDI